MKCYKPLNLEARGTVGCGQCLNCRINKRREWVGRMLIEANDHPTSAFVTLTYSDENLPKDGQLCKTDLQKFLKKLRMAISPRQIRYYAVGEYGEKKLRPHYHLIIFGLSPLDESIVKRCWSLGFIVVGTAEPSSMSYCSYYLMKNQTRESRALEILGWKPEFSMMSLKPALGSGLVNRIVSKKMSADQFSRNKGTVRIMGLEYPYGKTIRKKLENAFSTDEKLWKTYAWRRANHVVVRKYAEVGTDAAERERKGVKNYQQQAERKRTFVRRKL